MLAASKRSAISSNAVPGLLLLALLSAASPRKVAVMGIQIKGGVERGEADMFGEFLQNELRTRGQSVIGKSDIEALLGLERMKDAVGCTDTSCLAEIGGALGVDEMVTGAVAKDK